VSARAMVAMEPRTNTKPNALQNALIDYSPPLKVVTQE
jgi:hypothetical protein